MRKPKVFLTGGDGMDRARDEEINLLQQALEGLVELSDLASADVVHAVWWESLLRLPPERLAGKRIICEVPHQPYHYFEQPCYRLASERVGCWIVHSSEAERELASVGISARRIPYRIDARIFKLLPADDPDLAVLRDRWKIPADAYLIGSFQRDTQGHDLNQPKLQRGPDIFAEIMRLLIERGCPVHVVLAGPRRRWLRRRLAQASVPYTFIGEPTQDQDDMKINTLDSPTLNLLYNLVDVLLISSRGEGGPKGLLAAAAAQCKVVSTPVGLAEDVLETECRFAHYFDGAAILEQDLRDGVLDGTVAAQFERIQKNHTPEKVRESLRRFYERWEAIPPYPGGPSAPRPKSNDTRYSPLRITRKIIGWLTGTTMTVGLWHSFYKPPYGGGNQFMLALRKALRRRGVRVSANKISRLIDVYLLNSVHFDRDRFSRLRRRGDLLLVHRVDGPIHLYRGSSDELDRLCFELNAELAQVTVLQSVWTYREIVKMGYQPVQPVVIHNAADPDIFHPRGRVPFDPGRKIKLISTSWSKNPNKGGPVYKWLDQHLDWSRFEYTFVGNCSEAFEHIRQIAALPSAPVAELLRQHDIYLTASRNDPCSNALIEAQSCGLPALYLDSGGHPELVGQGGLPFAEVEEIIPQLELLVENYESFQNLIVTPTLAEVADKYLALLREVAGFEV